MEKQKRAYKMDMKEFIAFCKAGNPINGDDKELSPLLNQCSFEAQILE